MRSGKTYAYTPLAEALRDASREELRRRDARKLAVPAVWCGALPAVKANRSLLAGHPRRHIIDTTDDDWAWIDKRSWSD